MISERREVPPGPGGESGIPSAPASGDLTEGAFLEAVPVERFSLGDVEGETSRYRLGRLLGEGGMGSVFEAEQLAPVRRQVAIKLIKLGMDTRQVVARFRAERQALAMMEHPGIARVFDAGATATGRPFYAMELVDGEPITRYCDRLRFTLRQRLALFATVCDAVQHAHQKGIIHRDLKAGNVLVTGPAGAPMAKVIDFGIARAISDLPGVAGLTLAPTQQGADGLAGGAVPEGAIGTPESMSPEQALGNAAAVDTRTDVYALGVLLYELLSGSRPFSREATPNGTLDELRALICEADPPRPSARVGAMPPHQAAEVARLRGMQPQALVRALRRELEWIPLKAMRKEPEARYASAAELAGEVRGYLAGLPLLAGPPSARYRLAKVLRRHRGLFVGSASVALVLLIGIVATTSMAIAERRQARRATEAEHAVRREQERTLEQMRQAEAQRDAARRAQAQASAARDESEAVTAFLTDMLTAADPGVHGRDVGVRQVLDEASVALVARFGDRPTVLARLHDAIGRTFESLGLFAESEPHLSAALATREAHDGASAPSTLLARSRLARLYHRTGRTAEGRAMVEGSLKEATASLGPDAPLTLTLLQNYGTMLRAEHRTAEAEAVLRDAVARLERTAGETDPGTLTARHNLALLLRGTGRAREAIEIARRVLSVRTRTQGPRHPHTLQARQAMAGLLEESGYPDPALRFLKATVAEAREALGPDHPQTLLMELDLAVLEMEHGDAGEGLALAQRVHDGTVRSFGGASSRGIRSAVILAAAHRHLNEFETAESLLRRALDLARAQLGTDHELTILCMSNLAGVLEQQGDLEQAEAMLTDALDLSESAYGVASPVTLPLLQFLGRMHERQDRPSEAADAALRLLAAQRELAGRHHEGTAGTATRAVGLLATAGRHAEAEALAVEFYRDCQQMLDDTDPTTLSATRLLLGVYRRAGNSEQAAHWLREFRELQQRQSSAQDK